MARAIWKGAISFGLVHIPVSLTTAVSSMGIDFDWLDKRTMDPVGYKQINKATGREIDRKNIVKGVKYEKGRYVVLSEDEIKTAHPRTTQTIDIFAFVDKNEIPITHIDTPYYLAPDKRGEKVYALLREALVATGKVALANVVLRVRKHLAVVMPVSSALVIILMRWPNEVRGLDVLELDDAVTEPALAKSEKEMAARLINDMTASWDPDEYHDDFQEKIMALVEKKAREGKVEEVEAAEDATSHKSADIIDLTELLKRSLTGNSGKGLVKKGDEAKPVKSAALEEKASENSQKSAPSKKSAGPRKASKASGKTAKKASEARTSKVHDIREATKNPSDKQESVAGSRAKKSTTSSSTKASAKDETHSKSRSTTPSSKRGIR